jgi:hypothetical protein
MGLSAWHGANRGLVQTKLGLVASSQGQESIPRTLQPMVCKMSQPLKVALIGKICLAFTI